jgi:Protein of unknown function (DUF3592)
VREWTVFLPIGLVAGVYLLVVPIWLHRFPRFAKYFRPRWNVTEARVERVEIGMGPGKVPVRIEYSFTSGDTFYGGIYEHKTEGSDQSAWDRFGPLQGKTIHVRFNPANPSRSVVEDWGER